MKNLQFIVPCLAFASAAQAAVLLQENFNNLTADAALGGQSTWSGTGVSVASGGQSYSSANGIINIAGGANHASWSGVAGQPLASNTFQPQSGDVWFSLTLQVTATTTSDRFWFYVGDNADLSNSGMVGQMNNNSLALLGGVRIGATQSQTSTGKTFASPNANSILGTTVFIVGRYSKSSDGAGTPASGDYDRMDVWLNPDSTTLGSPASTIATTAGTGGPTVINTFALSTIGTGSTALWDNLRIGTTQADVLNVYAVPEPSSFAALAGLASLGLVATRRRRAAR